MVKKIVLCTKGPLRSSIKKGPLRSIIYKWIWVTIVSQRITLAEAGRYNRTNRTRNTNSTNQPTTPSYTTTTSTNITTFSHENVSPQTSDTSALEKLLGVIFILWMLLEMIKWLLIKGDNLRQRLFPPHDPDDEDSNPYLRKSKHKKSYRTGAGIPQRRIKLFEFEGPQSWDKYARMALALIPYALVRLIFHFYREEESDRLCLEFLNQTEKDAEKIFGTDTQPMDWVVHECNKIIEQNHSDEAESSTPPKPPLLRAGGGPRRSILQRKEALKQHDIQPTALCTWMGWWSSSSTNMLDHDIDCLVGGAKAPGTIKTYVSCFKHWAHFRFLLGKPCLFDDDENTHDAEKDTLRFCALHFGPLGKAASTINLYLQAIGYAHRLHKGHNPLEHMQRVKLLMQGARRRNGPPIRKLPISCEDLKFIRRALDQEDIDSNILFCTIALGWFFMLRRSEYLGPGLAGHVKGTFRHSVRGVDIEPKFQGKRTDWDAEVDSATLHLEGSKTDWLNQGTVRTHGRLETNRPNAQICLVGNLQLLFRMYPAKAQKNLHLPFARWENEVLITAFHITYLIKTAAKANGLNPDDYTLHSLRSGGATALYRATGDLDLVGRFGRWKGKSIHGYLWESHQMLIGIASMMTQEEGPFVHRATNKSFAQSL